ncbi:MAG TPA: hypothetical protein ENK06_06270 [Gammaproteobacteria bacterium]|nr:hypothetical protein [Gammaproteobacteria bacterium]
MAKRLFSCALTATEELDYFSEVMAQNGIEHYVVPGTAFGLSKPSFWIKNNEDFAKAKQLFKAHEETYAKLAREKYQSETGYKPAAKGKEKYQFLLQHFYKKRFAIPWIILGFVIIYWYLETFISMFKPAQ